MRLAGHVARTGDRKVHTGIWWGYLRERDHLEEVGVDGKIILKWIFGKCVRGCLAWINLAQDKYK
jgi:hypothetical protein